MRLTGNLWSDHSGLYHPGCSVRGHNRSHTVALDYAYTSASRNDLDRLSCVQPSLNLRNKYIERLRLFTKFTWFFSQCLVFFIKNVWKKSVSCDTFTLKSFPIFGKALTITLLWSLVEKARQRPCTVPTDILYSSTVCSIAQWACCFHLTSDEARFFCAFVEWASRATTRVAPTYWKDVL